MRTRYKIRGQVLIDARMISPRFEKEDVKIGKKVKAIIFRDPFEYD